MQGQRLRSPGQLEILHIRNANFRLTAELIDKLAESLIELCYDAIVPISHNYNLYLLSKLKNLRTLIVKLRCLIRLETRFIVDISENCKKLECIILIINTADAYDSNCITLLFNLRCLKSLVLMLNQCKMPYEELDRLFRKAPNLKFFVLSSCLNCKYGEDSVQPCYKRCKECSDSNRGVIITAA